MILGKDQAHATLWYCKALRLRAQPRKALGGCRKRLQQNET